MASALSSSWCAPRSCPSSRRVSPSAISAAAVSGWCGPSSISRSDRLRSRSGRAATCSPRSTAQPTYPTLDM
eukprot:8951987-Pyramimonas_sp.AAC.1